MTIDRLWYFSNLDLKNEFNSSRSDTEIVNFQLSIVNSKKGISNMKQLIPVKRLRENAILPTYGTEYSAGADLYACLDEAVTILPGQTVLIPLGFAMELPAGYAGFVFTRSGLATKRDLAPANKVGVIDADYRGECMVPIHNHGSSPQTLESGERIAQMAVLPFLACEFLETEALSDTKRGAGGFGSTGR